ncbi:hypothetical protein VHA_003130 [Grimontia hollisae CIP 101886]|uniref:Uncharacterized protein n=1 Tax=Grimontia hollisae CIP 101886 TaxID=675812 RepID=D0IBK3_GRIHO|nr:hypothetical protein VHA_003130 [Grimontia hollisae CIP 101886]
MCGQGNKNGHDAQWIHRCKQADEKLKKYYKLDASHSQTLEI